MSIAFRIFAPLAILGSLITFPVQAQTEVDTETMDPGEFYGFWEFQEPAGDKAVVIIKRGGRLSCFWAGSSSRAIQKGSWERTDSELTARWETGHVDVFRKLGENAIERSSYDPDMSLLDEPTLVIRGVRVDSRIPGSLTVQSEGEREALPEDAPDPQAAPAIPMRNAYIGYWKIEQSTGIFGIGGSSNPEFYLRLSRSGDATVSLRDWEGDQAVQGKWRIDGEQVIVTWPNDRRDVLRPRTGGGYVLESYRPKDALSRKPRSSAKAEKIVASEAERFFQAGDIKRLTVVDIRGTWTPVEPTGRKEYISIEGWGNAYRFPSMSGRMGTDPGKWRLLNDRVIITWVDGSKDVIRIAFPDLLQESFGPNEPITGSPNRTIRVDRTSEDASLTP